MIHLADPKRAQRTCVGVRRVEELKAWQLADAARQMIHAITATGPAGQDFKFCHQLRDSASSVTRNIAEGFGRYQPREFARFLRIARGSLFEVDDTLRDGAARGYWTVDAVTEILVLTSRSGAAITSLIRYLQAVKDF